MAEDADDLRVLEYATLGDLPPQGSPIVLERFEDGIRLTDPPRQRDVPGGMIAGGFLLFLVGLWIYDTISNEWQRFDERVLLIMAALLLAIGLIYGSLLRMTRPTVVEVRSGRIRLWRPVLFRPTLMWRADDILKVYASFGSPTVTMGVICDLKVWPKWGAPVRVLNRRDRREMVWAAKVIGAALNGSGWPAASSGSQDDPRRDSPLRSE